MHAGQRSVKVSILHEKAEVIAQAITVIINLLTRVNDELILAGTAAAGMR